MGFNENSAFKRNQNDSNFKFANVSGLQVKSNFYQGKINEIQFIYDINNAAKFNVLSKFNYLNYADEIRAYNDYQHENEFIGTRDALVTAPQYIDKKGDVLKTELFDAWLSTKKGDVFLTPGITIDVNLKYHYIEYTIYLLFNDTKITTGKTPTELISLPESSLKTMSFNKNAHQVLAIKLSTQKVDKFVAFVMKIAPEIKVEEKLYKKFISVHSNLKNISGSFRQNLRRFYSISPKKYLKKIGDEILYNDLVGLIVLDNMDEFWDASKAIINFLGAFNDERFIYDKFNKSPATVINIYKVLNKDEDKQTFCSFITALSCSFQNPPNNGELPTIVELGEKYEIDSDLFFGAKDSIRIKNDKVEFRSQEWMLGIQEEVGLGIYSEIEVRRDTLFDKQFNPLEIVIIRNNDNGDIFLVSSIQVKLMADQLEWIKVKELIYLSINLIIIALPFLMYIQWGIRGFFLTLSVIEGGAAFIEIIVKKFEKEILSVSGGAEFLRSWNTFYNLLVVGTVVIYAPILLLSLGKFLVRGAIFVLKTSLELQSQILIMLRIALIESPLIRILGKNFTIIVNASKHLKISKFASQLLKLQNEGVLITKLPSKNINLKEADNYVLSYENSIIAEGKSAAELEQNTKLLFGKNGEVLVEAFASSRNPVINYEKYIKIYRVQGGKAMPNSSRHRLIYKDKSISIIGNERLYVTFIDEERVLQFWIKRGEGAEVFTAEVSESFFNKLFREAVPQKHGKLFPEKPQFGDASKTKYSLGIPENYFDELLKDMKNIEIFKFD